MVLVFNFSKTLLQPFAYVHSHTCLSLMLVVGGLFERCLIYLLVCICAMCFVYTLPVLVFAYVGFSVSNSLILILIIVGLFVNSIRSAI